MTHSCRSVLSRTVRTWSNTRYKYTLMDVSDSWATMKPLLRCYRIHGDEAAAPAKLSSSLVCT